MAREPAAARPYKAERYAAAAELAEAPEVDTTRMRSPKDSAFTSPAGATAQSW